MRKTHAAFRIVASAGLVGGLNADDRQRMVFKNEKRQTVFEAGNPNPVQIHRIGGARRQRQRSQHDDMAKPDQSDAATAPEAMSRARPLPISRRISRAALWPGSPVTPPPGWVDEPHI